MIITIAGKPGAGKTTVAKLLAEGFGFTHLSTGDMLGEMALKRGISIDELNKQMTLNPALDREFDEQTRTLGQTSDDLVIDSWMAWFFIPNSFKIYLDIDMEEAAKRIYVHQRPDEPHQNSPDDEKHMLEERYAALVARWKTTYNIDISDLKNYEVVINTTGKTTDQVLDEIIAKLEERVIARAGEVDNKYKKRV